MKEATFQEFAATIGKRINGNKTLTYTAPDWLQHSLNQFKEGEKVTVIISTKKPRRSEQQNRYYWGAYLPLLSKETGETIERLHELFKGMFLTKEVVPVLGHNVRIRGSSANLSKADFTAYIMAIEDLTGIQSPPTENYFDNKEV